MKKYLGLLVVFSVMFFVFGCTVKQTKIPVSQEIKITITAEALADAAKRGVPLPSISQTMTLSDSMFRTDTNQDAQGELTIPVAQRGGVANADSTVSGVEAKQDNRDNRTDYDKPIDNSDNSVSSPGSASEPQDDKQPGNSEVTYNAVHRVDDLRINGNRTWERFAPNATTPGDLFGKNILVKFSDGSELFVPDGSVDYAPNGSSGDAWICGTMSSAGESQGQTGGVWGPAGATWYEIYYNKVE